MDGQAKYDVMMVFCGSALQQHHKGLKTSKRRFSDCHKMMMMVAGVKMPLKVMT